MAASNDNTVLIGYDGSDPARSAIEQAGRLFPGGAALIATSWHSVREAAGAGRAALPQSVIADAVDKLDAAAEAEAARTAEEGAQLARRAGLQPSPITLCAEPSVWASIDAAAERHGAQAVVVGSRGRSGIRSAVLGSVSNALAHHCRRPVLIVHPTDGTIG